MELNDEIEVNASVDEVWEAFNDVERIAPCLPGAQLQEIEDDEYRGVVKVKVGPITAQYKGKATFVEQNRDDLTVTLRADGRDTRGAGNANAVIKATLTPVSDHVTQVAVSTDLTITGKVAQFGRGVMADVSTKLMSEFAGNLEQMLEAPAEEAVPAGAASNGEEAEQPGVRTVDMPEPEAVDLLDTAGAPLAKRVVPVLIVLVVLVVIWRLLRRS